MPGYWIAGYWLAGYWLDGYWLDAPGSVVRSVIPHACRHVAADLGAGGIRVDPRACEARPAT